jgi:hypothetical protein
LYFFLQEKMKAYTLMQSLASGLNGLLSNFIQGMTKFSVSTASIEESDDDGGASNENDEVDSPSSDSDDNHQRVHAAAAQHHMRCAGKEPVTVQTPTTAQPEASTSAHPSGMLSHIMAPSASVILQPNIVEESVLKHPAECNQ